MSVKANGGYQIVDLSYVVLGTTSSINQEELDKINSAIKYGKPILTKITIGGIDYLGFIPYGIDTTNEVIDLTYFAKSINEDVTEFTIGFDGTITYDTETI